MTRQASRTPEPGISRRQGRGVAERGLNRIAGQKPGKRRGAEDIAAAGGVEGFDERRWNQRCPNGGPSSILSATGLRP